MKDLFQGPVFEFLKNENINNSMGWGGNGGSIDSLSEVNLKHSRLGTNFMRETILNANTPDEFHGWGGSNPQPTKIPYTFVETGTNYGSFSYMLYETLDDFKLYTCDLNPSTDSERCINFINNHYQKNNVEYHNTSGASLLRELKQRDVQVDFAWLDSGHTYDVLIEELYLASELNPMFIMVDDIWFVKELQHAVCDFIKNSDYKLHSCSNVRYAIGSILVLKKWYR